MRLRTAAAQTWRDWMRLVNCPVRFYSQSSSSKDSEKTALPAYNFGLPGKGKRANRKGKGLDQHSSLRSEGEVVFGIHPVTLALSSHLRSRLHTVYMDSRHREKTTTALTWVQHLAAKHEVPVQFVHRDTLTLLSGNRPHQGVCLDASPRVLPHCDPQQLLQGKDLGPSVLWLLLYNVQDPMNFGAILRTSHFLGVDRVLVPSVHSCSLSPVVSKASAGAMEVMDLHQIDGSYRSLQHLTQVWQRQGGQVVGTTSEEDSCRPVCGLKDFTVTAPTLLIVGNEGSGLDVDVVELCDALLSIPSPSLHPTPPTVTSLNVSVATGILLHWLRTAALPKQHQ